MKNRMKSLFAFLILLVLSCNSEKATVQNHSAPVHPNAKKMSNTTIRKSNTEIVNVALIYIKDGQEEAFDTYKKKAGALLEKFGGKIERIIQPKMLAKGNIELPDEIHFANYPNMDVFKTFNAHPEVVKLRKEFAKPSIERIEVFPSKNTDFEYQQEHGDFTKTYGVALVYLKEGTSFEKQFAEYHDEACEIIPEFGAHFERFIAPFTHNGTMGQPNEIHRFYFDSPDGMKKMGTDERMQKLFPKRDNSLDNLIFILGEAIQ